MRTDQATKLIAGAALLIAAATPVFAETPLPEFSGQWAGRGTDRDTPLESAQPTACRITVKADRTHMTSDTECNGERGLRKRFHLALTFTGSNFTGKAEQTSWRAANAAPIERAGAVSGSRRDDTANFTIHMPGLTPNAHVVLKLTSPTSFSMLVSSLGATLTDVRFQRPAAR